MLVNKAVETGWVETREFTRGTILVARRGYDFDGYIFDDVKNVPAKSEPAKKVPPHSTTDESPQEKEGSTHPSESARHFTRQRGSARAEEGVHCSYEAEAKPDVNPEWITLSDWKSTQYFQAYNWQFTGELRVVATLADWKFWLDDFGGAPDHLKTPAAHRQALEIVHELSASARDTGFLPFEGMIALACEVSKACAKGKPIRSLGLIAEKLIRKVQQDDLSWVFNRPTKLDKAEFEAAYELASETLGDFKRSGYLMYDRSLLSTYRLEELTKLIQKYGRQIVVWGFNRCRLKDRRPEEGSTIIGWLWFREDIEQVYVEEQSAAAEASKKSRRSRTAA